jgi:hypothetical protein
MSIMPEPAPFVVTQPSAPPNDADWEWFHITLTVYGAWLYGDPRGFRTRHHREHIEGDYKNPPPPGMYEQEEKRSRRLLKHDAVELPVNWRAIVGQALVTRLVELRAFVLCVACARQHSHLLAKLPADEVRNWSGLAKKHAWFEARALGWTGKLWAKRGHEEPVRDREHQLNAYHYILDHIHEGAWVWDYKRGVITK